MKRSIVQLATLATLFVLSAGSQLCPPDLLSTDTLTTISNSQLLVFPTTGYFFVENRQQDWLLLMIERSLLVNPSDPGRSFASLRGYLYTPGPNRLIYYFYAEGLISDLNIRSSPDVKWVTLKNIQMNGTSNTYLPPLEFTVTIPYADFWSDEPADDISTSKSIYEDPESECVNESLDSSGTNHLISKSFPINFDFNDGLHLEFIIPQGQPNAVYTRYSSQQLYINCGC